MSVTTILPAEAEQLMRQGARLVDVRDADEFAREHIPGADCIPLARIEPGSLTGSAPVVFHCRSGLRTAAQAQRLALAAGGACHVMAGGLDGWRDAGLPTQVDTRAPLELMRQVQLVAGALILLSVLLAAFVAQGFMALAGLVGAGLMLAGATGFCGMARLLARMPWNRRAGAA